MTKTYSEVANLSETLLCKAKTAYADQVTKHQAWARRHGLEQHGGEYRRVDPLSLARVGGWTEA